MAKRKIETFINFKSYTLSSNNEFFFLGKSSFVLICKRRNNSTEIQPSVRIISNHPTFCEVIMNIWSKQNFNNLYVLQLFWQKDKYLAGKKRLKLKFLVAFFYFFLTHGNILRELSF